MDILDYHLPETQIAFSPSKKRDESKLLFSLGNKVNDHVFSELPSILKSDYNLILNQTKVVNARMILQKPTGGLIEVFCLEPLNGDISQELTKKATVKWNCLVGKAKKWKEGIIGIQTTLNNAPLEFTAKKIKQNGSVFTLEFAWSIEELSFGEVLDIFGKTPLPPYIKREVDKNDTDRYQTVFAQNPGSVAAPTASLHFTPEILKKLEQNGTKTAQVTLHVGAGTFKPISDSIEKHIMHNEMFEVQLSELERLSNLDRLIGVGTTAVRTVESLFILANSIKNKDQCDLSKIQQVHQWEWQNQTQNFENHKEAFSFLHSLLQNQSLQKIQGYTNLMIVPGFEFKVISGLITNFHLPKSTLLLLVSALIGEHWKKIYNHAVENNYRFLSYGDSSLLIP